MERVKLPIHEHALLPISRFSRRLKCKGCMSNNYIYGGYRCNEVGCHTVFHKECAEPLPEINHSSHPDHPLKLFQRREAAYCTQCGKMFYSGYVCSMCDFKLGLCCVNGPALTLENSNMHPHSLHLSGWTGAQYCKTCEGYIFCEFYKCYQCDLNFHVECAEFFPEANHTSHPQHPLKLLTLAALPDYADKKCLLCANEFYQRIHHCEVCNFTLCLGCMKYPPPVRVESPTTHEHELHLVPRRIDFTCNACGMQGDRSPYFCLQCNFMIHRECIDLPRVININRHDHRISYTRRLGFGEEWKCRVCRRKVDGFYGAYTCFKCPSFAAHSLCATRNDVWDKIEVEGMPEEREIEPFKVIDDNTIKHFSHSHNLQINKDCHDQIQPDNIVCEACVLHILSEPFYSCEQCNFILHKKCANHPRKKRHVHNSQRFTLRTSSSHEVDWCRLCYQKFTGFRYEAIDVNNDHVIIDVRCAAISDRLEHESHQHHLYYYSSDSKSCSRCGNKKGYFYSCDECKYNLDGECVRFPKKVMKNRYDDHPLFLSFGDMDVDGDYWCEVCETKVNPKEWFYTCNDCGTILHISCVVGDFSYIMPGSHIPRDFSGIMSGYHLPYKLEVVSNTSICRQVCFVCNSRCKIPSILKFSKAGVHGYICSFKCSKEYAREEMQRQETMQRGENELGTWRRRRRDSQSQGV